MQRRDNSLIWGIILIGVGLLFLARNLGWLYVDWETIWPLFLIGGGILFYLRWLTNRKDVPILMPATILVTYGLLFEYCALYGWYYMEELWPVFLLGPGVGFYLMYFLGERDRGSFVAGTVLTVLAILFWAGMPPFRFFWPLALILIGIGLLFKARRQAQEVENESKKTSENS